MATVEDIGCAVGPEGNLKDASEIQWYHDKDDDAPIATAPPSPASNGVAVPSFFSKNGPVNIIAGSRRSTRSTRPSARILDPENAMNGQKRKAVTTTCRRVSRKVVLSEDKADLPLPMTIDGEAVESDGEAQEEVATEFKLLQEMADADHFVSDFERYLINKISSYLFIGNLW